MDHAIVLTLTPVGPSMAIVEALSPPLPKVTTTFLAYVPNPVVGVRYSLAPEVVLTAKWSSRWACTVCQVSTPAAVVANLSWCPGNDNDVMLCTLHDDVIIRKRFTRYWPFVRGIYRSPVDPFTKASDAELWCFLWYAPEQSFEQTIETSVIWGTVLLIMTLL